MKDVHTEEEGVRHHADRGGVIADADVRKTYYRLVEKFIF